MVQVDTGVSLLEIWLVKSGEPYSVKRIVYETSTFIDFAFIIRR